MIDTAMPARTPGPVPLPRRWSVGASEIIAVLVANGVLILGMWLRHGGLDQGESSDAPGALRERRKASVGRTVGEGDTVHTTRTSTCRCSLMGKVPTETFYRTW